MPRLLVLTTLPQRRPEGHRFERVNGRHALCLSGPRRIGLPFGSYPRLLLAYMTTEAVRTKNPRIHLGAAPNDLTRRLGLSVISGPRGTANRLGQRFFEEIVHTAVPIDLRALRQLQRSPLAIDLYVWLTYRMSYLRRPTLVPWKSLDAQFGSSYTRLRDFRYRVSRHLESVLRTYPRLRLSLEESGLRLYPSPPHVRARVRQELRGGA